jgi:hypothetical protein
VQQLGVDAMHRAGRGRRASAASQRQLHHHQQQRCTQTGAAADRCSAVERPTAGDINECGRGCDGRAAETLQWGCSVAAISRACCLHTCSSWLQAGSSNCHCGRGRPWLSAAGAAAATTATAAAAWMPAEGSNGRGSCQLPWDLGRRGTQGARQCCLLLCTWPAAAVVGCFIGVWAQGLPAAQPFTLRRSRGRAGSWCGDVGVGICASVGVCECGLMWGLAIS